MANDFALLAALLQRDPSVVIALGPTQGLRDGITVWVNPAFEMLFGVERGELLGQPPTGFLDDRTATFVSQFMAQGTDEPARLKNAWKTPDSAGETRFYDFETVLFADQDSNELRVLCRYLDCTEREHLQSLLDAATDKINTVQNRFEHAVNTIPEGFAMFDRDDRLVAFNSKYTDLYKETAPAIKVGATFESIMRYGIENGQYPEAQGCEEAWLAERLDRANRKRAPVERKLPGGRYLRVHEVENEHGDLVGLRSDVTHYYKQQEALEQKAAELAAANEEVRAASEQKERFFARMSHELRTPMNGILGMAEILQHSALDPEQEVYIDTISRSASSLLGIINDILDYSKAAEGKFTFANEAFSLEDTLFDAARLLQPLSYEKKLELWIDYPETVPTHFIGDSARVRQVILNHLGNALKFTDEGHFGVRVAYDANASDARLKLSIVDTGRGIPDASLASLFSAYEQVNQDPAHAVEGTGLGLAIARSLVEQMGGTIEVSSAVGQGSCFTVSLDLAPCPTGGTPSMGVQSSAYKRDVALLGPRSQSNTILSGMLEDRGYSVHWIGSDGTGLTPGHHPLHAVIWDGDDAETRQFAQRFAADQKPQHCAHVLMVSTPQSALLKSFERIDLAATVLKPARVQDLATVLFADAAQATPSSYGAQVAEDATPPENLTGHGGVLVVDDNKTNRLVAGKLLETAGVRVDFACDGLDAVRRYEALRPGTIFMDVTMPVLNGLDATRRIRELEAEQGLPACTVYALTANTAKSEVSLCLDAGMNGVIGKPVKRRDLVDAIVRSSTRH